MSRIGLFDTLKGLTLKDVLLGRYRDKISKVLLEAYRLDREHELLHSAFKLAMSDAGARAKRFREERNKWKSLAKRYAKALKANGIELPQENRPCST